MGEANNIVLICMPGAGKSTVGVVAAKILGKHFIDADLLIQGRFGRTLAVLIDELGPEGFIEIENEVLREIECENTLVATGGSAIYSEEAMAHLKSLGTIVYLEVSLEELKERLGELAERGVVMRGDCASIDDLYVERVPLYERWADITIEVAKVSIREAAQLLAQALAS